MQYDFQDVCITKVKQKDKSQIWQALQLHLRELSADNSNDRVFTYKYFDHYWSDPAREPLLFRLNGNIIGFALINDWPASGRIVNWSMAEFFILDNFRRSGLGTYVAKEIIGQRKGSWEIPVLHTNRPAQIFWRAVALSMTNYLVEEFAGDGDRWMGPIYRLKVR